MRSIPSGRFRAATSLVAIGALLLVELGAGGVRAAPLAGDGPASAVIGHLVISEVMTGGASASDEFVELYNPAATSLPLDGLELVYVTASGATVTRKAIWSAGTFVPANEHVLVANEAGLFAILADVTYANGLAATGGSLALRAIGATTAVDAVGWGTAASAWLEAGPAPAPPAGSSLERLPGGELGSGQDTDQNLVDFVVRGAPDPQNSASAPVPASASPSPSESPSSSEVPTPTRDETPIATPSASILESVSPTPSSTPSSSPIPTQTPAPTSTPTSTPPPAPITVAQARALPDGTAVIVRGITLSASGFAEGGGYLADATAGIAVLLEGGAFPRGVELTVAGVVDDRFAQRTIRVDATDIQVGPPTIEPDPLEVGTGGVGEAVECQLVAITGTIQGSPTLLAAGLAFEVDDGSGPIRVLVAASTGIDTDAWDPGTTVTVVGVVGQRDSSGTGLEGYRLQPRDPADVVVVPLADTPTPTPSVTPVPVVTPAPTASPTPVPTSAQPPLVTIAQARRADTGTKLRIRGVVTLPTGLVEEGSAVVADASGAILVRMSGNLPRLRRGQLVELSGSRSTKSGMASLRVGLPPLVLGAQAEPEALRRATGMIREADEALLVAVRGIVKDLRKTSGGVSFTVNDGSGPVRVAAAAATGITGQDLGAGAWVEVRAVVGQETSGSQPNTGYRLWPRDRGDIRVIARSVASGAGQAAATPRATPHTSGPTPSPLRVPRPVLAGESPDQSVTIGSGRRLLEAATRGQVPPIPVPLAAGLGGLAGLLVLAWRHGTWGRLRDEVELRAAFLRARTGTGDEEDESYTPAP